MSESNDLYFYSKAIRHWYSIGMDRITAMSTVRGPKLHRLYPIQMTVKKIWRGVLISEIRWVSVHASNIKYDINFEWMKKIQKISLVGEISLCLCDGILIIIKKKWGLNAFRLRRSIPVSTPQQETTRCCLCDKVTST